MLNDLLDSASTEITIPGEETATEATLHRVTPTEESLASSGRGEDATEETTVTIADSTPKMVEETTGQSTVAMETEGTSPSYTKKAVLLKEELFTPAEVTTTKTWPLPQSSSSVTTNRVTTDKSNEEVPDTSTLIGESDERIITVEFRDPVEQEEGLLG